LSLEANSYPFKIRGGPFSVQIRPYYGPISDAD
jgi:hypothetical protein